MGPSLKRSGDLMTGSTTSIGLSSVRMMPTTEPSEKAITQAAEATPTVQPKPSAIHNR